MTPTAFKAQCGIDRAIETQAEFAKEHCCGDNVCGAWMVPSVGDYGYCTETGEYMHAEMVCWNACDRWRI